MELETITDENIEKKIIKILIKNKNKLLTQFDIYNEYIESSEIDTSFISPLFKLRLLMILQQLPRYYDHIQVYKLLYYEKPVYKTIYDSQYDIKNIEVDHSILNIMLPNWPTNKLLNSYIIDNSEIENFNKINIEYKSGNNILHEIVIDKQIIYIKKLLEKNKIDICIKNNLDITPIELIQTLEISNIFLEHAFKKIKELEETVVKLNEIDELIINKIETSEQALIKKIDFLEKKLMVRTKSFDNRYEYSLINYVVLIFIAVVYYILFLL